MIDHFIEITPFFVNEQGGFVQYAVLYPSRSNEAVDSYALPPGISYRDIENHFREKGYDIGADEEDIF